jgi:hypothetical protein
VSKVTPHGCYLEATDADTSKTSNYHDAVGKEKLEKKNDPISS